VKLLLGLPSMPSPHDAADALAVAICHVHAPAFAAASASAAAPLPPSREASADRHSLGDGGRRGRLPRGATSWRTYKPA
jgi:Crossover junction endodeoxyribonuclease RuvC